MSSKVRHILTPDRQERAAHVMMALRGLADAVERGQIVPERCIVLLEGQGVFSLHLGGSPTPPPYLVGLLHIAANQAISGATHPQIQG